MAETSKVVPTATRKPPNAGKGRKKGVPNKTTTLAKEAIALAAEKLGGTDRLVKWAQSDPDNERVFWAQIYTKLLPHQVETGPAGFNVTAQIVRKIVNTDN